MWIISAVALISLFLNFAEFWQTSKEQQPLTIATTLSATNPVVKHEHEARMATSAIHSSSSSNQKKNPNEIFVAGVMFSAMPKYIDALRAEYDTWMQEIPNERVFAVGPADVTADENGFPRAVQSPCVDRSLWCKRVQQIVEAYKLLKRGINFDWLLSGNEDWYVHLPIMRESMAKYNPSDPVVYSGIGCNIGLLICENQPAPRPHDYPVKVLRCEDLEGRPGFCFGGGVVFSRAAVEKFMQFGEEGLFNITKSLPFDWKRHPQDDQVLAGLMYIFEDQGMRMEVHPWSERDGKDTIKRGLGPVGTVHAVAFEGTSPGEILRKVHQQWMKKH